VGKRWVLRHGLTFGWVVADPSVLHEHGPALFAGELKPFFVCDGLVGWDAVVLRQRDESEACVP